MISKMTLFTLILIVPLISASVNNTPNVSVSDQPILQVGKQGITLGGKRIVPLLRDMTSLTEDVHMEEGITIKMEHTQTQPISVEKEKFKELMEQEKYGEIIELGVNMNRIDFLMQIYPLIKSLEPYKAFATCFKHHGLVPSFFLFGNMKLIREIIVDSKIYDGRDYNPGGDLELAMAGAFDKIRYYRFIDLLVVRQKVTVESDKQFKQRNLETSFERYVCFFFDTLMPWKNVINLKRFFDARGKWFRKKYPEVYKVFCQKLLYHLKLRLGDSNVEKLLIDLVGQPSLLSPVSFSKGFLSHANNSYYSRFIKYCWREAMLEHLKEYGRGKELWNMMTLKFPKHFPKEYPSSVKALTTILKVFPTKRQYEELWAKNNAIVLFKKIEILEFIFELLPKILWTIVTEYAISWTETKDLTNSAI